MASIPIRTRENINHPGSLMESQKNQLKATSQTIGKKYLIPLLLQTMHISGKDKQVNKPALYHQVLALKDILDKTQPYIRPLSLITRHMRGLMTQYKHTAKAKLQSPSMKNMTDNRFSILRENRFNKNNNQPY